MSRRRGPAGRCPYCSCRMVRPRASRRNHTANEPTRDHILPRCRARLAPGVAESGIRNLRKVCWNCNQLRARVGHCPAALACMRALALRRNTTVTRTIREVWEGRWNHG